MPGTHTILVVDDDEMIHGLIASALAAWPFHVLHAYDGEDGVRAYHAHAPSLLLLDINMPLMNGFQVLGQLPLKANPRCAVIVMSAFASAEEQVRCLELGACMFVEKPFQIMTLINSIHAILAGKGPGARRDGSAVPGHEALLEG